MQFTFALLNREDAQEIYTWRYSGPYAVYSLGGDEPAGEDDLAEMLDRRSPYYGVRNERGELVGFFNFGTSALVWDSGAIGVLIDKETLDLGLGLRPDLTGKGLGLAFVEAGLDFARATFAPRHFRLFVLAWNERAIRVYERAGFQRVRLSLVRNIHGEHEFLEMCRDA
ncbi:GNAT family N-acetyltransferase [Ktedonosporobacter rubrisoli]|uniref:GNAT family N-acetyltransferase n=1 Tax=Ktedonosporobacter rubrisoli TaxID=2509675 RepID=A0A4V0YZV0_KTERU|nr:GNAT family N-acetyltransferase [Ktedonosporobacter rubrisoli]QBD80991.1 GNAT family N-acetyltransferase [Ktedonosporobacter rubrisoli]